MNFLLEYANPETVVLRLSGRFDTLALNDLKARFSNEGILRYIIADMSHTTFIDSLGLAVLVSMLKMMRARGGNLYIVNPADGVRLLLELTRMNTVFKILGDVEMALLNIQRSKKKVLVTALPVQLISATAEVFQASIMSAIEQGTTRLILDASMTEVIDNIGLNALISIYKAISENNGLFAVAQLQENARQIFKRSRIDIVLPIYHTIPEALAALEN